MNANETQIERALAAYETRLEQWRTTGANLSFQAAIAWLGEANRVLHELPAGATRDALDAKIKREASALDALIPVASRDLGREIGRA